MHAPNRTLLIPPGKGLVTASALAITSRQVHQMRESPVLNRIEVRLFDSGLFWTEPKPMGTRSGQIFASSKTGAISLG